jgi:hypothetical protein
MGKSFRVFAATGFIVLMALNSGCESKSSASEVKASKAPAPDPSSIESPLKTLLGKCYFSDLHEPTPTNLVVNGHTLNVAEAKNVQWIHECVLPFLPGTLDDRLTNLAEVTWWSLREGVMELSDQKVFRYSLCHDPDGVDRSRSTTPLYDCGTNIWQVGLSAGQSINYSLTEIDQKSAEIIAFLGAGIDQAQLLEWTASLSGFDETTEFYEPIVNSTLRVRRSWFIRNPLVGFALVRREAEDECLADGRTWCFSGSYLQAVNFAHTRADMLKSIADLREIYTRASL